MSITFTSSRRWADMAPEVKQRYQQMAEEGRQKYDQEMAAYRQVKILS